MDLNSYIAAEQKQSLSANQVQALNILALTNQELEDFMVNEYLENPMLENAERKENEIMTSIEKFSDTEAETAYADQHPGSPDGEEPYTRQLSAKKGNQLKENLLGQLNWNDYSKRQWKIMSYLVDCLDEKGFFTHDVTELADTSGYGEEELNQCLAVLRELEPVGIFSPNLAECLIKQLEDRAVEDETLFLLLREHLADLVSGQIGTVSRSLGISTIRVKEYIHLIGSLNPRPIMDIQRSEASYVVPDILVSRLVGRWNVEINDQWMGDYKYSDYYIRMMKESTRTQCTTNPFHLIRCDRDPDTRRTDYDTLLAFSFGHCLRNGPPVNRVIAGFLIITSEIFTCGPSLLQMRYHSLLQFKPTVVTPNRDHFKSLLLFYILKPSAS